MASDDDDLFDVDPFAAFEERLTEQFDLEASEFAKSDDEAQTEVEQTMARVRERAREATARDVAAPDAPDGSLDADLEQARARRRSSEAEVAPEPTSAALLEVSWMSEDDDSPEAETGEPDQPVDRSSAVTPPTPVSEPPAPSTVRAPAPPVAPDRPPTSAARAVPVTDPAPAGPVDKPRSQVVSERSQSKGESQRKATASAKPATERGAADTSSMSPDRDKADGEKAEGDKASKPKPDGEHAKADGEKAKGDAASKLKVAEADADSASKPKAGSAGEPKAAAEKSKADKAGRSKGKAKAAEADNVGESKVETASKAKADKAGKSKVETASKAKPDGENVNKQIDGETAKADKTDKAKSAGKKTGAVKGSKKPKPKNAKQATGATTAKSTADRKPKASGEAPVASAPSEDVDESKNSAPDLDEDTAPQPVVVVAETDPEKPIVVDAPSSFSEAVDGDDPLPPDGPPDHVSTEVVSKDKVDIILEDGSTVYQDEFFGGEPPEHLVADVDEAVEIPRRERTPFGVYAVAALLTVAAIASLWWLTGRDDNDGTPADAGTDPAVEVDNGDATTDQPDPATTGASTDAEPAAEPAADEAVLTLDHLIPQVASVVDRCDQNGLLGTIIAQTGQPVRLTVAAEFFGPGDDLYHSVEVLTGVIKDSNAQTFNALLIGEPIPPRYVDTDPERCELRIVGVQAP